MQIGYVKEKQWTRLKIWSKPIFRNVVIRKYGYDIIGNTMVIKFISAS